MPLQHRILALVYHDFEALDLFGPLGTIVPRSDYYTLELVNVHTMAAPQGLECSIKNSIGIMPNMSIADALKDTEPFDTLFIPGGLSMIHLLSDPMLLKKIGQLVDRARLVFTVCTGSLILAATGRLNGREATCNKRIFDEMTPKYPDVKWKRQGRWVDDGKFLTSSGITAGIDAGFAFLAKTYVAPESRSREVQPPSENGDEVVLPNFDKEKAQEHARSVAWELEYRWNDDSTDDPFV
ncbi:uncharacterized protein N7496_001598 [Penicillium cataractarum]|uniref:DJ-1/PfpI domain-containing protein n=1 Tax=Penicillium cataractarum TaxID=2100454 RepID=A0A9X0B736_9EURO|nr:uncharacterized protein N7496_001598 [Penicillium cataractarum]KAJ5390530.1 hypothetical protein N7496_001598 [Penicillium cataractarum]